MDKEIAKLEQDLMVLQEKLLKLRQKNKGTPVKNYKFKTQNGEVSLLDLFGEKDKLIVIHNMGQGCRYCTLWADGMNGFVPHLENALSLVLVSKDEPDLQRQFANSRGWRYRMASHAGTTYLKEQGGGNMPGAVCYERRGGKIYRKNSTVFGPNDAFCAQWPLLSLAGMSEADWVPQFNYWLRPKKLLDGGKSILE